MRILEVNTAYPEYLKKFYILNPNLASKSYKEQKQAIDYDAFTWSEFWTEALTKIGYEATSLVVNAECLQYQWAIENNFYTKDLNEIAFQQIKQFKPDILWYGHYDTELLLRVKKDIKSIKLVLGWVGSAIPNSNIWKDIDLILSCAPETVNYFNAQGVISQHLNHGFDPRILGRLKSRTNLFDLTFIGQLVRASDFHLLRDEILEEISKSVKINIFSPASYQIVNDNLKYLVKKILYHSVNGSESKSFLKKCFKLSPKLSKVLEWDSAPIFPVNKKLMPFIKPAVFGLEMFQAVMNSKIVLNIHANSSPHYASNMRLFEVTGVGTCLLTDWKKNIGDLFEPDIEVVTYQNAQECIEKAKWLIDNPGKANAIAKKGQLRTFMNHSFDVRAGQLNEIIIRHL